VVRGFTPTLDRVRAEFLPFLDRRDQHTKLKTYETVGPVLSSVSSAFSWGDRHGSFANFEPGAGESALRPSPCTTRLVDPDASTQEKIKCEVLTRTLSAMLEGRPVTEIKVSGSAVPASSLRPLLAKPKKGTTR
jgi:hypothetical protein